MDNQIYNILNDMSELLNVSQMKKLQEVLIRCLEEPEKEAETVTNMDYLEMFLTAKQIEGCSGRTIQYYKATIENFLQKIENPLRKVNTEMIRQYLSDYQAKNECSKVTVENVRRNLSSFFSWLEEEDHILKSPVRRIHKIKTKTVVKEIISDENIETLRDNCEEKRDLAIIDILYSTGMRVGELVNLDINDLNFEERECVVYGKGDKERRVYFDARTKLHLQNYLESRLRKLGRKLNIERIHPHKFRRTMATRAIDKGMPIEQVQRLLGQQQIDTTMQYAMVNQNNVKSSHRKFIA